MTRDPPKPYRGSATATISLDDNSSLSTMFLLSDIEAFVASCYGNKCGLDRFNFSFTTA